VIWRNSTTSRSKVNSLPFPHAVSRVNGLVSLGDGLTERGRYPGDGSHPVGSRGEDPIGVLVDEPPKLILILEMDVILIFNGGKKENAYMSR